MKLKPLLLSLALVFVSAAPDAVDLLANGRAVYTCKSFVARGGVIYLPLSEAARSLNLKYSYDPAGKLVIVQTPAGPLAIDSQGVSLAGKVTPLGHPPLWTSTDVFLPDEVFSGPLTRALGRDLRIRPHLAPPPPGAEPPPNANPVDLIMLDPGHGGADVGAKGPGGIQEKDVTLAIVKKLRDELQKHGLAVKLTRDDDRQLHLADRPLFAAEAGADLFVSIHANGFKEMRAEGFETFFASLTASDQASSDLARLENTELGGSTAGDAVTNDLQMILGDMAQAEALAESQQLAEMIQDRMATVMQSENRGVKQAPFRVLMDSDMPAVLVEVGFITSPRESRAITDPATQAKIVNALAQAIISYRDRTNARLGVKGPQ